MCKFRRPFRVLTEIRAQLARIEQQLGEIQMSQQDIDQATTAIQGEVTDLQAKDTAIQAAQQQLLDEIATLQGQGVNTTALVQATASLLQAQGADDATVQALTDAANQANPPAPPAA
jgi:chromosome segregation ATPase